MDNEYKTTAEKAINAMYGSNVKLEMTDTKMTLKVKNKKISTSIEFADIMGAIYSFEELVENFNALLAKQYLKELNK